MDEIIKKNNIKGPIKLLFSRSQNDNKNNTYYYNNMSASMPKIKVETENSSRPTVQLKNPVSVKGIDVIKDDSDDSDNESVSSGSTVEPQQQSKPKTEKKSSIMPPRSKSKFDAEQYQQFLNSSKTKAPQNNDDSASESGSEASGSDASGYSDYSDYSGSEASGSDASEKSDKKSSKKEKQEILLKLLALEKKGVSLTKKYSMSSKLSDLKFELNLHKDNAEVEASVKLQQKILMAAVTGLEFANKTFDPIGAKLDGWSESVMDNLDDYESIFVKLHEKYKTRADLPPELQLLVTLAGSAFMFHVTKTMFNSVISGPSSGNGGANVSNDILKNISASLGGISTGAPQQKDMSGPSINLASVLGNDDATSSGTVETSKEVTVNQKGKRSLNL